MKGDNRMEPWEEYYKKYFGKSYAYLCEVKNKLTERNKKSFEKKLENAYKKEFYWRRKSNSIHPCTESERIYLEYAEEKRREYLSYIEYCSFMLDIREERDLL